MDNVYLKAAVYFIYGIGLAVFLILGLRSGLQAAIWGCGIALGVFAVYCLYKGYWFFVDWGTDGFEQEVQYFPSTFTIGYLTAAMLYFGVVFAKGHLI